MADRAEAVESETTVSVIEGVPLLPLRNRAGGGAAGRLLRSAAQQPGPVPEQQLLPDRLRDVQGSQLFEASLRPDEGVVAAEKELVLEAGSQLPDHLSRDV